MPLPTPPPFNARASAPWRNERACAIFCVLKPTAHGATLFDAGLGREGAESLTHPPARSMIYVLKLTAHGATLFDAGLGREGAGSLTHPLHHALSRFRCFLGRNGGGFLRSGFMAATLMFSSWAFKQSLHARSRSKVVSCRWSPVENWTELSRLSKAAQARASVRLCQGTASLLPLFAR